jgi:uncharacterized membrane protein YheB (UPF0754 family)
MIYNALTGALLFCAASAWREASSLDKAISVIQKIHGWKKLLKEVWPRVIDRMKGQQSKESGMKELLISGLILLLSAMHIDAQEASQAGTLDKVIEMVEQHSQKEQHSQEYGQQEIDSMAGMIPFLIKDGDLKLLRTGLAPLFMFRSIFSGKVKEGLHTIKNRIMKDSILSNLSKEQLPNLIAKGLMKKIEDPKYKGIKEDLINYLKKKGQDLSLLELLTKESASKFFEKDKDFK